ncbi:MAG: lysylphosphatidylglycerol synthase transmembrane domain-containing protein, partial [Pseudomonadota bacterium]
MKMNLFRFFIALFFIFAIFFMYDLSDVYHQFDKISYDYIIISAFFIFINQILSSFRFKLALRMFDVPMDNRSSHKFNIYSIVAGIFFFNFIGQSISRSILMGKSLGGEAAFFVTAIERVFSLSILIVLSLIFSFISYGAISFDFIKLSSFLISVVFILISIFLTFSLFIKKRRKLELFLMFSGAVGGSFWGVATVTFLMHVFMMLAYLTLVIGAVGIGYNNIYAVLAILLTMLGASLPISFGGWGIREVTASFAFSAASLPAELGVAAGVGIGILTIFSLAMNVVLIWGYDFFRSSKFDFDTDRSQSATRQCRRLLKSLSWIFPTAIAILMMVQIPIPFGDGKINVNFADPVAIVSGMTFLLFFIQRKIWSFLWIPKFANYSFLAFFATIVIGYTVGYLRFGYVDWSFYNRFIGAGLLLSYLMSGAALSVMGGDSAMRLIVRVLFVSIVVMAVCEYFLRIIFVGTDVLVLLGWDGPRWFGLFGNPNAYAFFLVCCLPLVTIFMNDNDKKTMEWRNSLYVGLIIFVIYLTSSRAAYGAGAIVMIFLGIVYF